MMLSRVRKEVFIKAVAQSIPTYYRGVSIAIEVMRGIKCTVSKILVGLNWE